MTRAISFMRSHQAVRYSFNGAPCSLSETTSHACSRPDPQARDAPFTAAAGWQLRAKETGHGSQCPKPYSNE
eukprot:6213528-Pleurochrysis_carterae.AAC.2